MYYVQEYFFSRDLLNSDHIHALALLSISHFMKYYNRTQGTTFLNFIYKCSSYCISVTFSFILSSEYYCHNWSNWLKSVRLFKEKQFMSLTSLHQIYVCETSFIRTSHYFLLSLYPRLLLIGTNYLRNSISVLPS